MWFSKNNKDSKEKLIQINADEVRNLVNSHRDRMVKEGIEYDELVSRILNSPYLDKSFSAIINAIMMRIKFESICGEESTSISYDVIYNNIDDESPIYKYFMYLDDLNKDIVDSYAYIVKKYLSKDLGFTVSYDTNYEEDRILNISWK